MERFACILTTTKQTDNQSTLEDEVEIALVVSVDHKITPVVKAFPMESMLSS